MKKLVITLALMLSVGTMFAQNDDQSTSKARLNHFETNRFIDNWEISADAGVQTMYKLPNKKDGVKLNPQGFGKDFTLSVDAYLTKWITPVFGTRVGFGGLGFTDYFLTANDQRNGNDDGTENKVDYFVIHADFLANLTNWICGYKSDRFYNAIGFIGVGYANSSKGDDNYAYSGHNNEWCMPVGLLNRFRLCDAWSINLELRDFVVRQEFDNSVKRGAVKEEKLGNILSVTAGLTYRFPSKRDFNYYTPIDKSLYDNKISSLEKDLQTAQDQNSEYQKEIQRYKNALDEETRAKNEALQKASNGTTNASDADVSLAIFFPINQSTVSDKNTQNIKFLANVIKASSKDKVFTVTGYADKQTGTEEGNLELSQKRAENVYNALVNEGVDKSKLKIDYKGCSVQPFEGKAYLNRVAVVK
jgi:outer membrane protein OmpA-like peptidoglycan-associated protein